MKALESDLTTDDGVRLFMRRLGSGPQLLIVPSAAWLFDDFQRLAHDQTQDRTVVFYDQRNRGRSDAVTDTAKLRDGVHHDVDDLEAVRKHLGAERVDILGHSYLGLAVILYAMKYPQHVRRVIQIGAMPPDMAKQYPPHLTGADATLAEVSAKLAQLGTQAQSDDPTAFMQKAWPLMSQLFVVNPADAARVGAYASTLPNQAKGMKHMTQNIRPSLFQLHLTRQQLAAVQAPVLTIHGTRDRQAPYGGAIDWVEMLPNAQLVTIKEAAHFPWIERPAEVFGAIEDFLARVS